MQCKLKMTLALVSYLIGLRIILAIAVPVRFFQWGLLFDGLFLALMLGGFVFFVRSLKWQKVFFIFQIVFWTALAIADTIYHAYFFTLGSRSNLQGLNQVSPDLMTDEYAITLPLFYIPVLIIALILGIYIIRQKERDTIAKPMIGLIGYLAIVQFMLLLSFYMPIPSPTLEYYQSDAYLYRAMPSRVRFAEKYGYFYYHTVDLLRPRPSLNLASAQDDIEAFFSQVPAHQRNQFTGEFEGYNLIKITVESLDTRFIHPVISPNLYRMLHEGYNFENIFIPVFQQGATCNSEFMAMTSLYALNSNDHMNNICTAYNTQSYPYSLAHKLNTAGYHTFYFHSGYTFFYDREKMMPQLGYDTIKFIEDLYALGYTDYNERRDTEMMAFIDEFFVFEEPFYLELLTYGLHGAYTHQDTVHHDPLIGQVYGEDIDPLIRVYLHKLHEFDLFLGALIERLIEEEVYEQSLFVLYTDHYPYMLELDSMGEFIEIDPHSQELFRQSLIIYNANIEAQTFTQVGATIDIVPTILNLIYPEANFNYFFGRDLFNVEHGYALLHDFSITDGTTRFSLFDKQAPSVHLSNALEREMIKYDLMLRLLEIDYFNQKPD